jgi:hypothetical protein
MPAEVQAFLLLLVLLAALVAAFMGIMFLRRWLASGDSAPQEIFTLDDLRQLFRQGKITQIEFDQLKQHIVAMAMAEQAKPEPTPGTADDPADGPRADPPPGIQP